MKIIDGITRAHAEIGVKEIPANSNNVKYNTWYYGKEVKGSAYPWCCAFVVWLFRGEGIMQKTASCVNLLSWMEKNGLVIPKSQAQAGDIIFFKYSRNNARTNHVGIIVGRSGNTFSTVEGNTSVTSNDNGGCVMNRARTSNIVAFARPYYEDAWIEVKKGSKGLFVKKLQTILKKKYNQRIEVDGVFGANTFNALVAVQGQLGLVKDGIAGEKTWRAIM